MKSLPLITALISLFLFLPFTAQGQDYSQYRRMVDSVPFIVIEKETLTLSLVADDGSLIKQYGISCAKIPGAKRRRGDLKTPEGVFTINEILKSSYLSHDFGDGKGPIKGAYGPFFLRLSVPGFRDIGIHGTHKPESIGSRDTEGCIRLVNEDIKDLRSRIVLGTPVIILPAKADIKADAK